MAKTIGKRGLHSLIGKRITLFCLNYFYTGKLTAVLDDCVLLTDKPQIVYETGAFSQPAWSDAQTLPNDSLYVMKSAIESFGVMK